MIPKSLFNAGITTWGKFTTFLSRNLKYLRYMHPPNYLLGRCHELGLMQDKTRVETVMSPGECQAWDFSLLQLRGLLKIELSYLQLRRKNNFKKRNNLKMEQLKVLLWL